MPIKHQTGITSQWHTLVTDAQSACGVQLKLNIEGYLVNTLVNYSQRPEIAARIFAIDYMLAQNKQGQVRHIQLRDVADQCLLYAGLFPQYAKHHNVKASYYINIGRSAYSDLSNAKNTYTNIFAELSECFVELMDTLLAIHHIDDVESGDFILDPIHALQTWQQTKSQQALKMFQQQVQASNVVDFNSAQVINNIKH